jgi:hypothetical protein
MLLFAYLYVVCLSLSPIHNNSHILYAANGAEYEGGWKDNMKDGKGIFIFETGYIHFGEFVEDKMVNEVSPSTRDNLHMNIEDLIANLSGKEAEHAPHNLLKVVFRFNSDLRNIYKNYTLQRWEEKKVDERGFLCLYLTNIHIQ